MDSYGAHMFTEAVQAWQDKLGVRDRYAAVYARRGKEGLDADARAFIESRDSVYLASVSETGWPYVQHRGGPPGFLKVLDDATIGFADYAGNKQMITRGNLGGEDRVSLFAMDYPRRARLKLIAHAAMVDAADAPDMAAQLAQAGAPPAERLVILRVTAFDWNCPKYITPRYTEAEVAALVGPHLAARDRAIAVLSRRLRAMGEDPEAILQADGSE